MSVRDDLILDIRQAQSAIDALEAQITAATTGLTVDVTASTEGALAELEKLRTTSAGIILPVGVDPQTAGVSAEIERSVGKIDVPADVDTKAASLELDRFRHEQESTGIQLGLGDLALTGGAIAGLTKLTTEAAELEQSVGGVAAIFKSASGQVESFVGHADKLAGLSELAARQLTSRLGGALKGLGLDVDEAAEKSVNLTQIGADLAATMGGETRTAVEALGATFLGEFDSAQAFGLTLTQAQVDARAVALGLADTAASVTAAARAQATYSLILERTADSQGQFVREIETASGQAAVAAAQRANAAAELGANLLPLYTTLSQVAGVTAEAVGALPAPLQAAGLALIGLGAVARPVKAGLQLIGDAAGTLRTRALGADGGIRGLTTRAAGLTVELGLIYGVSNLVSDAFSHLEKADLTKLEKALLDLTDTGKVGGEAARIFGGNLDDLAGSIERIAAPSLASQTQNTVHNLANLGGFLGNDDAPLDRARQKIDDLDTALATLAGRDPAAARQALDAVLADLPAGAERLPGLLDEYNGVLAELDTTQRTTGSSAGTLKDVYADLQATVDRLTESYAAQFGILDARLDLERGQRDSLIALADAQDELADFRRQVTAGDLEGAEAAKALRDAQNDVDDSTVAVAEAAAALRVNQLEATGAVVDAQAKARILAQAYQEVADGLAPGSPLRTSLEGLIGDLEAVAGEYQVDIRTEEAEANLKAALIRMQTQIDLNPLSIDVLQSEKFVIRGSTGVQERRLGGGTLPGWVLRGEDGPELTWENRAGFTSTAAETRKLLNEIGTVMVAAGSLRSQVPQFGLREHQAAPAPTIDYERLGDVIARKIAETRPNVTFAPTVNNPVAATSQASLSREAQSFKNLVLGPS